ncbi:Protein CBG19964 [Caenorhabditis briggsae]|uniref:Glucosylceramidase n=1 Tax=Caenorhabditis briggsae TaxID=6238 RepID=A8XWU0_CAEBR|nr:Protein CBG19964 [Caenorhabditis briggsae]CAP37109.1 Protein CBG19964 [Caenorhabditis briggsae]
MLKVSTFLFLFLGLAGFSGFESKSLPCSQVQKDHGIVCRCNATYCDTIEPLGTVTAGKAVIYTTSKKGKRMDRTELKHSTSSNAKTKVYVNGTQTYQQIMGFGAAFTDAAGINMLTLPQAMQDQIIQQYFSDDGLGYVFGRVPMASCDFSTHEYSYDDVAFDFQLTKFNLTMEDFQYKIPFIKKAMAVSNGKLKLFATPWSSPAWMKTSGRMIGAGELIGDQNGKYYQTWAQYFVKFFEAYHAQGIDFWSLTPQNEPTTGIDPFWKWQTLYFDASMERNFIKKLLGPALAANPVTKNMKIMINDDQRINLPHWPKVILSDPMAAQYVNGIALHWYEDFIDPATVVTETHNLYPDYFILATEACAGYEPALGPKLGSWSRAEQYANDLIKDIGNWVAGWVDWNYMLDLQGGPNLVKNFVDATLIVNATAQEYYKQPIWHVMAQFSKFIKPGSTRIQTTIIEKSVDVEGLSFLNADGTKTVVLLNKNEVLDFEVAVSDVLAPNVIYDLTIQANSLVTIVYK